MVQLDDNSIKIIVAGSWLLAKAGDEIYVGTLAFEEGIPTFIKVKGNLPQTKWYIRATENYYLISKEEAMLRMLEI